MEITIHGRAQIVHGVFYEQEEEDEVSWVVPCTIHGGPNAQETFFFFLGFVFSLYTNWLL